MREYPVHVSFSHGDHICTLYETEAEHLAVATTFIAEGLQRGERCLYVAETSAALRVPSASGAKKAIGHDPDLPPARSADRLKRRTGSLDG